MGDIVKGGYSFRMLLLS